MPHPSRRRAIALSLFAALYGAFWAARRMVRPIQDLVAGTRAVAKGDFVEDDLDAERFTVRTKHGRCWLGAWFQHRRDIELPSVVGQPLPEIALPVQERDADER